jgi:hypothetical protein
MINEKKNYENLKTDYFENIDTKEKAYWLGFLYADGYVGPNGRRFGMTLALKDEDQMDRFMQVIGLDSSFKKYYGPYKNTGKFLQINISNEIFVKNLINKGCTYKKTFTISFPELGNIEFDLAFLLGFYDGDGSSNRTDICCGNINFLNQIKEKFKLMFDITERKNKYGSAFYLNLGAELKRKLLKNYPFSMDRKKLLFPNDKGLKTSSSDNKEYNEKRQIVISEKIKNGDIIKYEKFKVSKEELEELIKKIPYTEIGKLYNVTGNAIKKRARKLGITLENRLGYWGFKKNAIL